MRRPHKRSARLVQTIVTVTGPGQVKCGLCQQTLHAPYQAGIPAPCGCNWLWYGSVLAAFPNRDAERQHILTRNRRRALSAHRGHRQ